MKVVFLINSVQNQRCIKRVNEFVENGYEVEAYGFSRKTEMRNTPNFKLNVIGDFANNLSYMKRFKLMRTAIKQVVEQKKKEKGVVFYLFSLDIALHYRLITNHPYIYEESDLVHTYMSNALIRSAMEKIDKAIIRKSMLTVFTSEGFAKYHYGNHYPENIFFITNRLAPSIQEYSTMHDKSLDVNHLRFAFVGGVRFNALYSFSETLLRYFPQHEFHFYGHVDVNFQNKYKSLEKYSNCYFHGAFKNPDDLPDIYSNIDIVLSTYDVQFENIRYAEPNKLYEAMYFETPIIVSTGTFLAEKVGNMGIGYDVDAENEQDVCNLVSSLSKESIESRIRKAKEIDKRESININDAFFERLKSL